MSENRWFRFLSESVVSVRRDGLRADVVAGLTTGAVIIPKAMAYAMIAGLPVQVGLYTVLVPMVIYAVLGTSRVLSVSTTTTLAILTAAQLGQVVPSGDPAALLTASATLTLLVGAALLLACLLRLGFVANFISEPVLIGFKAGVGLVIVVDQVPKITGIHFLRGTFIQNVLSTVHDLPKTSLATLAVGLTTIVFLLGMKRLLPKVPAPLLAAAAAIVSVYFLNLQDRGVELVGHIPQGLPSLMRPDLSLITVLWPGALGIALMSFTETVAAGQAFARKDEPAPRANTELLATGLANIGGALIGAMPGGGGTTQTAVNVSAGAADLYSGEQSISTALHEVLNGIVARLDAAHAQGRRLQVPNPVHPMEDFSERWDACPGAYLAFNDGIRKFATAWREVCLTHGNPGRLAKGVFGRVIDEAILREARNMQADRSGSLLGVASMGCIVPATAAVVPMLRNTNHGAI